MTTLPFKTDAKRGIVLSGGGSRGVAHLGVLKALEEYNLEPDFICGVSSGAIIGAFYADGWSPEAIFDIFQDQHFFNFVRLSFPITGMLKLSGFTKLLKDNLSTTNFEDLQKKLLVMATNFNEGAPAFFEEGDLLKPTLASSSIPVLFSPVKIGTDLYVDGGLIDNMPYEPANEYCDFLMGVHVNPLARNPNIGNMVEVAERTFQLSVVANIRDKYDKFDLLIEPQGLDRFNILSLANAQEIFDIGYEGAIRTIREFYHLSKPGVESP